LALNVFPDSPRLQLVLAYWAVANLIAPLLAYRTDGPPIRDLISAGSSSEELCDWYTAAMARVSLRRPAESPQREDRSFLDSYFKHLDRGDWSAATKWINLAIGRDFWTTLDRGIAMEAAYFSARHENSPVEARTWLDKKTTGYPVERFVELRAEASVLLAEGRIAECLDRARRGRKLTEACRPTGWTRMNAALLQELETRASSS
jgi:hypothetical protein